MAEFWGGWGRNKKTTGKMTFDMAYRNVINCLTFFLKNQVFITSSRKCFFESRSTENRIQINGILTVGKYGKEKSGRKQMKEKTNNKQTLKKAMLSTGDTNKSFDCCGNKRICNFKQLIYV